MKGIYTRKANIVEAKEDQSHLLKDVVEFNNKSKPRTKEGKDKKRDTYEKAYALYEGQVECFQKWNISNKSNTR